MSERVERMKAQAAREAYLERAGLEECPSCDSTGLNDAEGPGACENCKGTGELPKGTTALKADHDYYPEPGEAR